ncbi:MAG: 3-dehydroquinate synthase [Oligoflexia bacterium]|nr:3-dehydroquinate synthase [Oligoflexia bacterium]
MSDAITVNSFKGPYNANFISGAFSNLTEFNSPSHQWVIDRHVAELYQAELRPVLDRGPLLIDALEENKALDKMPMYVEALMERRIRRDHTLVAVGGGIIQDIVCFLAAVLMRGIPWVLYPTTLLAQSDSCIGSKSSINSGRFKNIVGTFTPPNAIYISSAVLRTLTEVEFRSGLGEMLKVHLLDGIASFREIAADYDRLASDPQLLENYIRRSLLIKRRLVEADEFDRGIRNILNYGHSFGHAIESATRFAIPHGVAITIGMDLANYVAYQLGIGEESYYLEAHVCLQKNYCGFENHKIDADALLEALGKDKKNTDGQLGLILPDKTGRIERHRCTANAPFRELLLRYLEAERTRKV